MFGVTNVGDVAKTSAPLPVSSVTAAARFALVGVVRNVWTPVPGANDDSAEPLLVTMPLAMLDAPVPPLPTPSVPLTCVPLARLTVLDESVEPLLCRMPAANELWPVPPFA